MTLGKMTDANNLMNPQHFGSDLVSICIQIRINLEMRIRITDHFQLSFDASVEACAL